MPEKITSGSFRPTEAASARRTDAKPGSGPVLRRPAPHDAGDTVELTHSAKLMSRLEDAVAGSSIVDAGRVRSIKDALAAGTYAIDPDRIAERMIRAERELR